MSLLFDDADSRFPCVSACGVWHRDWKGARPSKRAWDCESEPVREPLFVSVHPKVPRVYVAVNHPVLSFWQLEGLFEKYLVPMPEQWM